MIETGCRCGAIGLRISGEPAVQLYCHCDDCQAAHGAAYVPAAIYPRQAVEVAHGEPVATVVRTTQRMRCADCGAHLYAEPPSVGMRSVSAYALPKGAFKPRFHTSNARTPSCPSPTPGPITRAFSCRSAARKRSLTGRPAFSQRPGRPPFSPKPSPCGRTPQAACFDESRTQRGNCRPSLPSPAGRPLRRGALECEPRSDLVAAVPGEGTKASA